MENGKGRIVRPFFVITMTSNSERKRLGRRERFCVQIAALYALRKRTEAFALLQRSSNQPQIKGILPVELFFHLSLLLGFPNMLDGLEKLAFLRVLPRRRGPVRSNWKSTGLRVLGRVYGNQTVRLLESLRRIHPDLPAMIVENVYGQVFSRPGMSLREREIVNVTVLTIQGLDRQLYSHIRGALRVGVNGGELRSLFTFLQTNYRVRVERARRFLRELERAYR